MTKPARGKLRIGDAGIAPGERATIELPITQLFTHTPLTMAVQVLRGRRSGPVLFVCAAIHGDEINGVEIIRRLLKLPALNSLRGTLIAVPIVNVHGFLNLSRYLPDRRDLNRSFPGSQRGSVAGRIAHRFASEIVAQSDYGIDLHTGAVHRPNLPQIRSDLSRQVNASLAEAFGAPVVLPSEPRLGSLREHAEERGVPLLVYEGGEALRFDEGCIRTGLRGIVRVMRRIEMLPSGRGKSAPAPVVATASQWIRAPASGILRMQVGLGDHVRRNQPLALVSDPFGENETAIHAAEAGVVIGRLNLPLVNEGDALFHIARVGTSNAAEVVQRIQAETEDWLPLPHEPPII